MEKDVCKLQVGQYQMHFNGYQPDSQGAEQFCEDIPSTGRTVIVLDFIDDNLRKLPIDVRVVKASGSEADLAKATVFHVEPRVYPTGSLSFSYDFKEGGNFIGLVSAGGDTAHVARFPFAVGSMWLHWRKPLGLLAIMLLAVGGLFGYSTLKRPAKRSSAQRRV
ncbi:hypothetical protein C1T17_20600 (plasmid) [Sphingobium sp. SCG-1]|nr:hypothetical protein C1T17_20600 [Sphingobium sp. SCG-1]